MRTAASHILSWKYPTLIPSVFFFTRGPGNEERRLILGALIQNLKNEAPVQNCLITQAKKKQISPRTHTQDNQKERKKRSRI